MEVSSKDDKDAVLMTYQQATNFQWELVHDWTPSSDVWALKGGSWIMGGASGICGFIINMHYRNKLKLGKYGHFASYLPLVIMPTVFCSFYHRMAIQTNILVEKKICPICIETQGVVIQNVFGVLYPIVLAPIANYMLASTYCTVRIPVMHTQTRKLWEFHKATSQKLYKKVPYMLLGNSILATFIIYSEFSNFNKLNEKINKLQKDMIDRGIELKA